MIFLLLSLCTRALLRDEALTVLLLLPSNFSSFVCIIIPCPMPLFVTNDWSLLRCWKCLDGIYLCVLLKVLRRWYCLKLLVWAIIFCAVFSCGWSTSLFSHWNPCIWLFVVIGVKLAHTFPPLPCFFFTYALGLFSCVHYCHLFQILPLVLQALAIFASFLFICFFLYVFLQLLLFSVLFSGSYVVDILKGRSNTYC